MIHFGLTIERKSRKIRPEVGEETQSSGKQSTFIRGDLFQSVSPDDQPMGVGQIPPQQLPLVLRICL